MNRDMLKALVERQDKITEVLSVEPCANSRRCLEQRGSYLDYDRAKMCTACELYWFADCARILLGQVARTLPEEKKDDRECPYCGQPKDSASCNRNHP